MAHETEEEVTSNSFDSVSSNFSKEAIFNLMKDCQEVMEPHSKIKEIRRDICYNSYILL